MQKERVDDLVAGFLEFHREVEKSNRRFFPEEKEDFVIVIE